MYIYIYINIYIYVYTQIYTHVYVHIYVSYKFLMFGHHISALPRFASLQRSMAPAGRILDGFC